MITSAHRLSLSLMLTTLPMVAHAISLGGITARSNQGEPLDASIELYLAPHERALPMVVSVTPDLFSRDRLSMQAAINGVSASVEHAADGYSFIHLRSTATIPFSSLTFRLRLMQAEQGLSRIYALNLPAPRPAAPNTASVRRKSGGQGMDARGSVAMTGDTYVVQAGDTLWAIARRLGGAGDLNARMQSLHVGNPAAFVDGDIDRLKLGAVLQLPGAPEVAASPPVATSTHSIETAAAAEPAGRDPFAVRQEEDPVVTTSVSAEAPAPVALGRDPLLTARLAELDTKFAAIRARYAGTGPAPALAQDTVFEGDVALADAVSAPVANVQASPAAPTGDAPGETVDPVATLPPIPAAVTGPAAADSAPGSSGRSFVVVGGLLALVGVIALIVVLLRRRQFRVQLQAAFEANEAARRAAVAAKAAGRNPDSGPDVPPAAVAFETVTDFVATLDGLEPEPKVVSLVRVPEETQNEIDANIAHGRYQDAERLLREVIVASPRNVAAKLRLAEVHYITEDVAEFIALADDLQLNHRGDMTNEDWRRIMRMGKIIAPDRPLFAGPKVVNQA